MTTATMERPTDLSQFKDDNVFKIKLFQDKFIRSRARYPAFVAAWATGKSMSGIARAMILSETHPKNLGVIFRKEYTDLRDSTIKDFEKYTGLKVNSQREVVLPNGSIIMFRHLEELNNLQNINLGWFWIEQAEELDSDEQFFTLHGRLRRANVPHSGFITANQNGHKWIYKLWKIGTDPDYDLSEATTFNNADVLPEDYIASLRKMETSKPRMYRRFVLNSWDEADTVDLIIQPDWVRKAVERRILVRPPIRKVVAIDVARYGDDKTIFYAFENFKVIAKEEHEKKNTMETVGLAVIFAKKNGDIKSFAPDEIGIGAGVVDRLSELGYEVIPVNSSAKTEGAGFFNRRAEIYDNGAKLLEEGVVQLLPEDDEGNEQLSWAKYKTIKSNGVWQVEAKDDIKKRYGRSPDNADALLIGMWAVPQAQIVRQRDGYEDGPKRQFRPDSA